MHKFTVPSFLIVALFLSNSFSHAQLCKRLGDRKSNCCQAEYTSCQPACSSCHSTCAQSMCAHSACVQRTVKYCGKTYKLVLTNCGPRVYTCEKRGLLGRRLVWVESDPIEIPRPILELWCQNACCEGLNGKRLIDCLADCIARNEWKFPSNWDCP